MNILVLNGSPKKEASNTYRLTQAFLQGIKSVPGMQAEIETVEVYSSHIEPCKGCFGCWTATPGSCVIHDDMEGILPRLLDADVIIWSFPLYYYGMPSKLKCLLDRNLPMNLPFITSEQEGGGHPRRYDKKPAENVVISTCGFSHVKNNYEALISHCDILFGSYTKILCPEGELFGHEALGARTEEYLSYVRKAGEEYASSKQLTAETSAKLEELLYPPDTFAAMANASWEIADDKGPLTQEEKKRDEAVRFTKQMAATYRPASFDGCERIFEIYYTDVKAGFQLIMKKDGCEVRSTDFLPYTTRVETPFTVWQDIANGVYSGEQAMMEGKYKTMGDLRLLISWGRYFGAGAPVKETQAPKPDSKKTNMKLLLFPWLLIWVLLPIYPPAGAAAGVCAAALLPLAGLKWQLTLYDGISAFCVSALSLSVLFGFYLPAAVSLSYLCFGLMWFFSCFSAVPLTAHYSKEEYNGDDALQNPLFLKTNRILTLCWAALYLVTPVWTYWIMSTSVPWLTAAVNTLLPVLLGVFTGWFQKWYPAKIARGR